jgi:hypothetical protein
MIHSPRRRTSPASRVIALTWLLAVIGCSRTDRIYTLYRSSVVNDSLRIHVATFDAAENEIYNRDNCEEARTLFQSQPGVKTRFWCEKGTYQK